MPFILPGQVRSRSLQGRDEPNIWFEAAAALPALEASALAAPALDEDAAEVKRQEAERLLEHEAEVFEKDLQKRNAADARWLQQVRKAGTTQDKIAAMTLLVQVRMEHVTGWQSCMHASHAPVLYPTCSAVVVCVALAPCHGSHTLLWRGTANVPQEFSGAYSTQASLSSCSTTTQSCCSGKLT